MKEDTRDGMENAKKTIRKAQKTKSGRSQRLRLFCLILPTFSFGVFLLVMPVSAAAPPIFFRFPLLVALFLSVYTLHYRRRPALLSFILHAGCVCALKKMFSLLSLLLLLRLRLVLAFLL
jgi:hypothetical protein